MKTNYRILFIGFFALCVSCVEKDKSSIPLVSVDMSKAEICYLDDIAENIECYNLNLPAGYYFGEIVDIQTHGDSLLLFHDFDNDQIYIFNDRGQYVNHLNRQGRGPGEYLNIEAFATNKATNQLIIYDHLGQKLVAYTLPDLKFAWQQRISKSLMSLAALSENVYFTISDEDEGMQSVTCDGAAIYNIQSKEFMACDIPNDNMTVNFSSPQTISYTDKAHYYLCPSYYSTLYELSENGADPVLRFHFGNKNLPEKLWSSVPDPLTFPEMVQNNAYVLMPHYFLKQGDMCSFCFFEGDVRHVGMVMSPMCANAAPKVIKQIKLKGFKTATAIKPLGVLNDKYICLFYLHLCKIDETQIQESSVSQMIHEKLQHTQDEGTPVLLIFQTTYQ